MFNESLIFLIHYNKSRFQENSQTSTYIIIPPNTAHTLKIKLDENPLGKIRFFVELQCSVTDILLLELHENNIFLL